MSRTVSPRRQRRCFVSVQTMPLALGRNRFTTADCSPSEIQHGLDKDVTMIGLSESLNIFDQITKGREY